MAIMNEIFRGLPIRLSLDPQKGADGVPRKVQVLRVGSFQYQDESMDEPVQMEITREVLASMVKNFKAGVKKTDLAMDYGHNSGAEAAGWFKSLELSTDGNELWAEIDWTRIGAQKLADKEFRYVSADFNWDYEDNESGDKFGPTLNGAGLTNRPFVKNMAPAISLHEGGRMAKKLDDTQKPGDKPANGGGEPGEKQSNDEKLKAVQAELDDMKQKYAAAMDEIGNLKKSAMKHASDALATEKKSKFDKMLSEGKVVEAQREPFMSGDLDKFTAAAKDVNLSERGHGEGSRSEGGDDGSGPKDYEGAVAEIKKQAQVLLSEKKVKTLSEAYGIVMKKNPKLSDLYNAGPEPKTRGRKSA